MRRLVKEKVKNNDVYLDLPLVTVRKQINLHQKLSVFYSLISQLRYL